MNAWMEASARISLSTANRLIGEERCLANKSKVKRIT